MCAECLMLLQLLVALFAVAAYGGSCREAALCCNGRDSACVVQKVPSNAITSDLNVKPCYCDHACLKLADCCGDFRTYCGVIDCVVSEWSPWSECDAACGPGTASRSRTVSQKPRNGGKHCPSLVQKRGCQGSNCRTTNKLPLLEETALLLPARASTQAKHENDTADDIRRNLKLRNLEDTFHRNRANGYCIAFEVMKVTKQCSKDSSYRSLVEGDRIVVRCHLDPLTEYATTTDVELPNNSISDDAYDDAAAAASDDDDDYNSAEYSSSSHHRTQPQSPNHCLGEGVTGRNTRFASMAMSSCHGKWLRLTVGVPKECAPGEAQFVFV